MFRSVKNQIEILFSFPLPVCLYMHKNQDAANRLAMSFITNYVALGTWKV